MHTVKKNKNWWNEWASLNILAHSGKKLIENIFLLPIKHFFQGLTRTYSGETFQKIKKKSYLGGKSYLII